MELFTYLVLSAFQAVIFYMDWKKPNFPFSAVLFLLFLVQAMVWLSGIQDTIVWYDQGGNQSNDGAFVFHTITYQSSFLAVIFFLFALLYLVKSFIILVKEGEKAVKGDINEQQ
jgi:hypothetical protein